ncbi:hypothetical protein BD626DRAFT_566851 [Schizophyllum amplum]|uniref:Uncharacterized protein n=1 Tax=Schizophyllum amplum TaxID=97359 RepID=A0A550CN80_9AGAR|nr:hypothetical protein BD626DRAFT_566851 [Auriculariopsis ampla]
MEAPMKRKVWPLLLVVVTAKVSYNDMNRARSTLATSPNVPRAPSPLKTYNSSQATTPAVRPRAKVNTSATPMRKTASGTSSVVSSPITRTMTPANNRPPISRSSSPARSALSPRVGPASRPASYARSQTAQSVPSTPVLRPTLSPDVNQHRAHHQSISFNPGQLAEEQLGSDGDYQPPPAPTPAPASGVMRIKAKLTSGAKTPPDSLSVAPSSASAIGRRRVHSISSNTSQSTVASQSAASAVASTSRAENASLYPITTSTPAANPHRYGSWSRATASDLRHNYQPFSRPHDDSSPALNHNRRISAKVDPSQIANFNAKVDPTTIPLPPHSPPTSALSYSSRSSISRSSLSMRTDSDDSASSASTRHNDNSYRSDHSGEHDSDNSEERQERLEAKSNRKIADLEITNKSLLAINATLEKTKSRQAKEIRDLKRKLRESRLILPPRAYRAVSKDDTTNDGDDEENEDEDDEDEDEELVKDADKDEAFQRVRATIEGLINSGKRALISKPEIEQKTTKVLTEEEVQSWRRTHGDEDGPAPDGSFADDSFSMADDSMASIMTVSEDEVEAMTVPSRSVSPDTRPPILVTTPPL